MNDTPTLVMFHMGWVEDGVGPDGLPLFKDQLMIVKSRPPLLRLESAATEADIDEYPEPYALFQREQAGMKVNPEQGYPLAMWPAASASQVKTLGAREIYTVEQLAKLSARGAKNEGMPSDLKELAERAGKLLAMQKEVGKFEQIIRDKDGQIEALREQVDDALKTIAAQKTAMQALKMAV